MRTKHGDHELVVTFPVFSGYKVYVVLSDDLHKSNVSRFGTCGTAAEPCVAAYYAPSELGHAHLFYRKDVTAGLLAHEAWHAVYGMFDWAGVVDLDNETVAYHLGYLVDKIAVFQAKVLGVKSKRTKRTR